MQSGFHNIPVINGVEQKDGANYKAKNSTFRADGKSATFSTEIAGAYPENARVKSWVRSYTLNRSKNFVISDKYELGETGKGVTTDNLITYCKVSQVKPGLLKFEGDGFTLNMTYNPKIISPTIEFREITDSTLKRYWPKGITRIRLEFRNTGLKGTNSVIFTKA
jgi:hypothetical protein